MSWGQSVLHKAKELLSTHLFLRSYPHVQHRQKDQTHTPCRGTGSLLHNMKGALP